MIGSDIEIAQAATLKPIIQMAQDRLGIPPEALHSQDSGKIIPPLHGALLKNEQDVHLFERLVFMARRSR